MKLLIILMLILLVACTPNIKSCKTNEDCVVTNYGEACCLNCDGEAVNVEENAARHEYVNTQCTPADFAKCAECTKITMRNAKCLEGNCV